MGYDPKSESVVKILEGRIMMIRTRLKVVLLGCALSFFAAIPAQAVPTFEFDLTFASGPLAPSTYTGTFSVDAFTGVGVEQYSPDGPSMSKLLSFDVDVDGVVFSMEDDISYPIFPSISFVAGVINSINYAGDVIFASALLIDFNVGSALNTVHSLDTILGNSLGTVTDVRSVPEPGVLALLSLGLAVLGFIRHRKKT